MLCARMRTSVTSYANPSSNQPKESSKSFSWFFW